MSQQLNAQFFITFFGAIPGREWCSGNLSDGLGRKCAYGHLNPKLSMSVINPALSDAFYVLGKENNIEDWAAINNNRHPQYQQPTEKGRIIAALRVIRDGQRIEEFATEHSELLN